MNGGADSRQSEPMQPLITINQLAELLGVTASTIRNWRSQGEGPPATKVCGALRWRIEDVAAWVESRREQPAGVADHAEAPAEVAS